MNGPFDDVFSMIEREFAHLKQRIDVLDRALEHSVAEVIDREAEIDRLRALLEGHRIPYGEA